MDSSRLRKAFRYPGDDEDEFSSAPQEGIDEEEQERLINKIATDDANSIAFYRLFFLTIPGVGFLYLAIILVIIPYPGGADPSAHPAFYMFSVLSLILSLCIAYDIETPAAEIHPGLLATDPSSESPLLRTLHACRTWLASINATVCGILSILALRSYGDELTASGIPISFSVIPVVAVFIIVVVARHELRPVNVGELERMKYEYKGA